MADRAYSRTAISKEIGWGTNKETIPSVDKAKEMITKADSGDESAAVIIFRWYRNCPSPSTVAQADANNLIVDAWRRLFK